MFFFCGALLANPASIEWRPITSMNDHIFPSLIIAGANAKYEQPQGAFIGEAKGLIGINIRSSLTLAKYRIDITITDIADPTSYTFDLPKYRYLGQSYNVFPNINYRYQALKELTQPTPANVTIKLYVDGEYHSEASITVQVHSINDCPFYVRRADGSLADMNWMFAGYVNENHPMIDQILREALNTGMVSDFNVNAYDNSPQNTDQLMRQAIAIWTALQNRGLAYSNTTTPSPGLPKTILAQRVRFFEESMNSSQANCVDGSVVFASVFRRIGLDPFLIMTPDHCFVGFVTSAQSQQGYTLETTAIGSRAIREDMVNQEHLIYYRNLFPPAIQQKYAYAITSFVYALDASLENYQNILPQIRKREWGYLRIDIDKARREQGVIPLAR